LWNKDVQDNGQRLIIFSFFITKRTQLKLSGFSCVLKDMSPNFEKIYKLLRKNYVQIPLERVGKKPYNNFVATLLSPRTRDEVTYEAFKRLKKVAKNFH